MTDSKEVDKKTTTVLCESLESLVTIVAIYRNIRYKSGI